MGLINLSWLFLKNMKFFGSKKGIELTMQVIVVIIILLALLVFLLLFFTGQSTKLTDLWNSMVGGGIEEAQNMSGP